MSMSIGRISALRAVANELFVRRILARKKLLVIPRQATNYVSSGPVKSL